MDEAKQCFKNQQTTLFINKLKEATEFLPEKPDAFIILAQHYYENKDILKALKILDDGISYNKDSGILHYHRGMMLLQNGQKHEACMDLKIAVDSGIEQAKTPYQNNCL